MNRGRPSSLARMKRDAGKIAANLKFAATMKRFVRESLTVDRAREIVQQRLTRRPENFLTMARRGVFENPRSAYRGLLDRARVDLARIEQWTADRGVEWTLEELRRRDIYVTYEEFKALATGERIESPRLGRGVDFDNPAADGGLSGRSGASRSSGTRVLTDFAAIHEVSVQRMLRAEVFGAVGAHQVRYFPPLPALTGISRLLAGNLMGEIQDRWFSPIDPKRGAWIHRGQMALTLTAIRLAGGRVLSPEYVPLDRVEPIARHVAGLIAQGHCCALHGYAGAVARVCRAARREGLDITGLRCFLIGEPVTEAKAAAVRETGAIPIVSYSMAEAGQIGNSCPFSETADDVHFFADSFALIRHEREYRGERVRPFLLTSLLPGTPKVFLNVEIDDTGEISERPCDCLWGRMGLTTRLRRIRSFVKLTAEGMTLHGERLIELIEKGLPDRFGGGAIDYQFVEHEDGDGRTRVSLRIDPAVGSLDETEVVRFIEREMRRMGGAERFFGRVWGAAGALEVVRQSPRATPSGKIFPFHTLS